MGFLTRLIVKLVLNGVLLYVATRYFSGFILEGGIEIFAVGALLLTLLNVFLRPILTLLATPFIWLTFGLFNIVIHVAILWFADKLLTSLVITDLGTIFWVSIIIAVVNSIF